MVINWVRPDSISLLICLRDCIPNWQSLRHFSKEIESGRTQLMTIQTLRTSAQYGFEEGREQSLEQSLLELLSSILREQGEEKRAEEVLQLSLSITEKQQFEDWRKPHTLSCLAEISMAQLQPARAKERLLEAYRILEEYGSEAKRQKRSKTHDDALNQVSRHVMQQIVAMTDSVEDIGKVGDWQSQTSPPK